MSNPGVIATPPTNGPRIICVSHAAFDNGEGLRPIRKHQKAPLPVFLWSELRSRARYTAHELCGVIDTQWNAHFILNDLADQPGKFRMNEDGLKEAIDKIVNANAKILGIFHTHPSGVPTPSADDIAGWPNRDLGWRYWIATRDDVYEYEFVNQPENG